MNRAELDALLPDVETAGVNLPLSALGALDASAPGYFGAFLPTGRLVLTGCSRTDGSDAVTVTGAGTGEPFAGMTVTLRLTLTGDTVTGVRLAATAGTTWSLADAFPLLRPTILDTLRFDAPTLVLDPATADPADPAGSPLAFHGDLLITPVMGAVGLLFPGTTHPTTGEITMVTLSAELDVAHPTAPLVVLYGPEGESLDLGLFTLTDLRYEVVGLPQLNYATFDNQVTSALMITGGVPVQVRDETRQVMVTARLAGWADQLRLTADFSELGPLTLEEIAAVAGRSGLPVPFGIDPGAGITLGPVTLAVTPSAAAPLDSVAMTLYTEVDWTVVEGLIVLQQIDLTVRVASPVTDPSVSVLVSGLLGIGQDGTLELAADSDTHAFGGGLREGDPPLRIRELYTHFLGGDATHLPDLEITRFHVAGTLPEGPGGLSVGGDLIVRGTWPIADQIELNELAFDVDHSAAGTLFAARAVFVIDAIAVAVQAEYDPAPERQWEFSGSTGAGQEIPIGALMESLAERYGATTLPAPIAGLTVDDLGIDVTTGSRRLFVTGRAKFRADGTDVAITVSVDTAAHLLSGRLDVTLPVHGGGTRDLVFDARFAANPVADEFVAAYSHPPTDPVPAVRDLVSAFSPVAGTYVPEGLVVDLRDVALAASGDQYVLIADLAVTFDFAHLPVVGEHLVGDTVMGLAPLRVIAASAGLPAAGVAALAPLLPATMAPLPAGDLAAGATFQAVLRLGPLTAPVATPVGGPLPAPVPVPTPTPTTVPISDGTTWYKIQRTFGPLAVDRVGLAHREGRLTVLLDASVGLAGLTLTLDGLAVGLSTSDPAALPSFGLAGMGVQYASGPIEVAGAFLEGTLDYAGVSYPAYSGGVRIRTEQFSLAALGSYAQLPEGPSLFVYAFLDDPVGGPPFFFVRGLAAGFGYNRRLVVPPVTEIASFPLVADAVSGPPDGVTIGGQLQRLSGYLPASVGDFFLTAGVHFTSFGMVDSFVLVSVGFGHRFELDVVGLSTLTLPVPDPAATTETTATVDPIAEVQLALRASFAPDDGSLIVVAQLTSNSFLLSRACHLQGGFAFATWFGGGHAGDFVITAGGYHPRFPVPPHYPNVPRLGFTWQVCPELAVSGSGYYALTPGMLMAGGSLHAIWQDDSLRAWFDASMDFLIGWQPYHYELDVHVDLGASYTFSLFGTHTISAHVGADLHLWGPDFAGTAAIDLTVVTVHITFGPSRPPKPQPVPWEQVRSAMLPAPDQVVSVTLAGAGPHSEGIPPPEDEPYLGVVDPAGLVLVTDSAVPSSAATRGTAQAALPGTAAPFGVGPAGRAIGDVTATHRITLTHDDVAVDDRFDYTPVFKDLPAAVWGADLVPQATGRQLMTGLLTGYSITPRPAAQSTSRTWLSAAALTAATALYTQSGVIELTPPPAVAVRDAGTAERLEEIMDTVLATDVAATRSAVIDAVLPGATVDLAGFDAAVYAEAPLVAVDA